MINMAPDPVDLTGFRLADILKHGCPVPAGRLAPGATLVVPVANGMQLGNRGGAVTLLDPQGLKVQGVSYTAGQAQREGWTILF